MDGTKTITVAGGNLFRIAAERLGSALQWTRIANLNQRPDPWIEGVVTLKIPVSNRSGGYTGILGTD